MRVTRKELYRIILEEKKKLLSEGCGGGCGAEGCGGEMSDIRGLDGITPDAVDDVAGYEEDYTDDFDSYYNEEAIFQSTRQIENFYLEKRQ